MDTIKLRKLLEIDEGNRQFPYKDSVGKITIGIGRNLTDVGVSFNVVTVMYLEDVAAAQRIVATLVPNYQTFTDVRQAVLIGLAFNLSHKLSTFNTFLQLVNSQQWSQAADDLSTTTWYNQVGSRGQRYVEMLKTGQWPAAIGTSVAVS